VAIENSTGEVRAMVGGRNYEETPFNLATEGERQPGSSFKVFDLAAALQDGISPGSVWSSHVKTFIVPGTHGRERFVVHNDEGNYTGSNTLTGATAYSDNSIYAEVGLRVGTHRIARLAHRMGIVTPISTNPAMTIGGLKVGVTPLDMAHAYETIAHGGERVSGTLVSDSQPVGIQEVNAGSRTLPDGHRRDVEHAALTRVLPTAVAETETSMLETVLQYGTAHAAALGQFAAGKTGTTSNFGDAWFVGWDRKYTVAVWVGYPNRLIPMTTEFGGKPVFGGTFPALIWHSFMVSAMQIEKERSERSAAQSRPAGVGAGAGAASTSEGGAQGSGSTTESSPSSHATPAPSHGTSAIPSQPSGSQPATQQPATPSATPAPEPAPTPASPPAPSTPAPQSSGGTAAPGG
jgi:penicillin-binding protein 1A